MVGVGAGRFGEFGVGGVEASGEREGEWRNEGRGVRARKGECGKECGTGTWEGVRVMGCERMGLRGFIIHHCRRLHGNEAPRPAMLRKTSWKEARIYTAVQLGARTRKGKQASLFGSLPNRIPWS